MTPRPALVLLALALAAAGCSGSSSSSQANRHVPHGTIVVGFPNDLSGPPQEISNGAKIAVREINGLGGINGTLKIRLLVRDSGGDSKRAGLAAAKLLREGARVLVLPCDSASQRAIARAAAGKLAILLATCDSDPRLTQATRLDRAVGMPANLEAAQLADDAKQQGYRRIRVVRPTTGDERILVRYFEAAARARSIRITGTRPDAVMTPLGVRPSVRLLRHESVSVPLLGTHLLDSSALLHAGKVAEGTTFTTYGFPDPGFGTDQFYETYRSYYARRPIGSFSALGYAAIKVVDAIVNRAESDRVVSLAHAFDGLDLQSALGEIDYRAPGAHNPQVRVAIVTVKDGRFHLVAKTVPTKVPAP